MLFLSGSPVAVAVGEAPCLRLRSGQVFSPRRGRQPGAGRNSGRASWQVALWGLGCGEPWGRGLGWVSAGCGGSWKSYFSPPPGAEPGRRHGARAVRLGQARVWAQNVGVREGATSFCSLSFWHLRGAQGYLGGSSQLLCPLAMLALGPPIFFFSHDSAGSGPVGETCATWAPREVHFRRCLPPALSGGASPLSGAAPYSCFLPFPVCGAKGRFRSLALLGVKAGVK